VLIKTIGAKIISLAAFWSFSKVNMLKLSHLLFQVPGEAALALVQTQEEEEGKVRSDNLVWYQLLHQCLAQNLSNYSAFPYE
jgi:hypothetical protein